MCLDPFTSKSDQCLKFSLQHHQMEYDYTTNSHHLIYTFLSKRLGECTFWTWEWKGYCISLGHIFWSIIFKVINPFTPESDQCQISPVASPEILHHTVWRTWLFIACSDARWLYYQLSLPSVIQLSLQGWENAVFELGSERVKIIMLVIWWDIVFSRLVT